MLYVSKRPLSDMVRDAILGMTYDKAYNVLISNGATKSSITEVEDSLFVVIRKSNWTVIDAEISESGGVLYAKVYLSHDKSIAGSIAKSIGSNLLDNFSDDHPLIGGVIEGALY